METSLEVLRFLASPFDKDRGEQWEVKSSESLDSLLNTIIAKCREKLELTDKSANILKNGGSQISTSWKLAIVVVDLLLRLKEEIHEAEEHQSEEERSIEVLSFQAQLDVQKCVELLVGFGIVPYLLQGVGVPEKLRRRNPLASELFLAEDRRIPQLMQFHRLAQIIGVILEVSSCPSLNALIIPKHATDILAGLLQICKSPIAQPLSGNESESAKFYRPGSLTQLEYDYVISIRQRLEILMENFLQNLPKSLLIDSLFLVGATEKPKWIRKVCNEMIYEVLLSPNGLILISSTLLSESSAASVWKLARVISNLMRDALTQNNKEDCQVERLTGICAQCVQMIICTRQEEASTTATGSSVITTKTKTPTVNETACITTSSGNTIKQNDTINLGKESRKTLSQFGVNQELSRIGLFCSIALMEINCQIVKRLVWDHLFNPVLLLTLGHSQMKPISGSRSSKENNDFPLDNSINEDMIASVDIEKVLVASGVAEALLSLVIPMGICLPILMFQPVWSLLFQVFVTCKNYLDKKIQEPIVAQLAEMLVNKLENVLMLLVEIVSSGAGDKLDLNSSCSSTNSNNLSGIRGDVKSTTSNIENTSKIIINNISEERAKTVCDFCVQLLLNENERGNVTINKFELNSFPPSSEVERESIKIVRVTSQSGTSIGCPSESESNNDNAFELLGNECSIFCSSILKHERVRSITSQLFCQLLSYENELEIQNENVNSLRKEVPSSGKMKSSHALVSGCTKSTSDSSKELTQLELEENISQKASLRKFIILKLLSDLGGDENVVEQCVKTEDYKETLKLVELVMRKVTSELTASSNTGEDFEFSQSVIFALGILGTIVETAMVVNDPSGQSSANFAKHTTSRKPEYSEYNPDKSNRQKGDKEFWDELKIFVPHLQILHKSNHLGLVSAGIPSMAENILISIETQGVGASPLLGKEKVQIVSSRYEKALKDVANPMLPIKGHGLLQLRRLIEEKDPETIKNDADLLQIFRKELINEDSYVYLMAIQGLAALGNKFHNIVVALLIEEYDFINPDRDANGCLREKMYQVMTADEKIECRMKIGEVLVKIIQKLGDIAAIYRVPLTNLFFRVVRDDEPLIRASALSNLGELCHLLKFSLGAVLTEVWYCIESLMSCEKDIHVRRAALHLLVLLLKGVEKDFSADYLIKDAQLGSYLRDVRRLLTRVEQQESDSVSKTHAQLALHELELIVKKLLRPSETLQYKIRV